MNLYQIHKILKIAIACVWLINGFWCKILNGVPRHEAIVSKILGPEYARELTIFIGISEVLLAIWVLTGIKSKWSSILQIIIVASMNILEFFLADELLLWGKTNALFALFFILVVLINEFFIKARMNQE